MRYESLHGVIYFANLRVGWSQLYTTHCLTIVKVNSRDRSKSLGDNRRCWHAKLPYANWVLWVTSVAEVVSLPPNYALYYQGFGVGSLPAMSVCFPVSLFYIPGLHLKFMLPSNPHISDWDLINHDPFIHDLWLMNTNDPFLIFTFPF